MGNHGSKQLRGQIGVLLSKFASFIPVKNPLRYTGSFDLSDPLSLITRAELDIATGGGFKVLGPWAAGVPTGQDEYRTHPIGDIEYLFRSLAPDNTTEPTLNPTTGAWIQTDIFGFIGVWNSGGSYDTGALVTGDANTNVYRSKVDDNIGNNPDGGSNPDEWELVGAYVGFYFPGTFNLGDVVIVSAESNRIYISAIPDNEQPITDIVVDSTWQVIGAPGGGSNIGSIDKPSTGDLDNPTQVFTFTDEELELIGNDPLVSAYVPSVDGGNTVETFFPDIVPIITKDADGKLVSIQIDFSEEGGMIRFSGANAGVTPSGGGGSGLELGETSTTAYRGDRGKVAYDYAIAHNLVDNTPDTGKPVSTAQAAAIGARIASTEKGAANGVAPLNSSSLIDAAYLPSYVDDVLEYANQAAFPVTGETGKIYIALDTNAQFRWSGSIYVELVASPGTTDNVPEGATNKYWTLARTVGALLTGFVAASGHSAVVATDTIMQAIQKFAGSIADIYTSLAGKANITGDNTFSPGTQIYEPNVDESPIMILGRSEDRGGATFQVEGYVQGEGVILNRSSQPNAFITLESLATGTNSRTQQFQDDDGIVALTKNLVGLASIAANQVTLTALTFASDSVSGTIASPITGNITGNVVGAQLGVTVLVIHNSGTEPTFDSKFKKLSGSGNYVVSQVNYIYCQYIDATHIVYSINQSA